LRMEALFRKAYISGAIGTAQCRENVARLLTRSGSPTS
jgi:hypothetical protein